VDVVVPKEWSSFGTFITRVGFTTVAEEFEADEADTGGLDETGAEVSFPKTQNRLNITFVQKNKDTRVKLYRQRRSCLERHERMQAVKMEFDQNELLWEIPTILVLN
jgi:hypothetical protein